MKSLYAAFILALAPTPSLSDVMVTEALANDLVRFDMTSDALAAWMQDVLVQRGYACSEVWSMGGQVPRTDPNGRRNVSITVGCAERSFLITVGVGVGWEIHD